MSGKDTNLSYWLEDALTVAPARSDWGGRLVAQMFNFLETMRLQGANAVEVLFDKLSLAGRSPPASHAT